MKKTKTTIIFTLSLIVALLSISVFVFFIKVIQNKNIHIQAVYATLEEKVIQKSQTDVIKKNNDFIKQSQERINSHFVDTTDISVFIGYLESIGTAGGTTLSVDNIENPATDEKIVTVKVSIIGSFSNTMRTIRMLEHIPYKIHFEYIYLNKYIPTQNPTDLTKKVVIPPSSWETQLSFDVLTAQ